MSGLRPQPLKLKRQLRVILEKLCRRRQTAHATVERSQIRTYAKTLDME